MAAEIQTKDAMPTRRPGPPPFPDMVWVPSTTYAMGSNDHYPEERPTHRVSVDGFWMDKYPVTNERFTRFVEATAYVTFAELPPNPADYPGALPEMLYAGSLVFVKPGGPVDPQNIANWWQYVRGADWRHPKGPSSSLAGLENHPVVHIAYQDAANANLVVAHQSGTMWSHSELATGDLMDGFHISVLPGGGRLVWDQLDKTHSPPHILATQPTP